MAFGYELFDHTADLGLRLRAADLPSLFDLAAQALFAAIVEDSATIRPAFEEVVSIDGTDREYLLFDWLRELLRRHDERRVVFGSFTVTIGNDGLKAMIRGEPIDPARHVLLHEVKAITYHELKIVDEPDGLLGEVIVDI